MLQGKADASIALRSLDFIFLLFARDCPSKLGSPLAHASVRMSFRPLFAFFLYEMNNNWKSFCIFVPIISKRNEYEIN